MGPILSSAAMKNLNFDDTDNILLSSFDSSFRENRNIRLNVAFKIAINNMDITTD